ncbi:MAG TPA: VOC family protein [Micromonosporaceae bacterium]
MTSKFTELAIDCADPHGLARFWCSVLDYEVQDEDDGIVTIGSPLAPEGKNHLGPVRDEPRSSVMSPVMAGWPAG